MRRALLAICALAALVGAIPADAVRPPWLRGFHPYSASSAPTDIYYYYKSSAGELWVRGNISSTKDIVQRYKLYTIDNSRVDFFPAYIISPSTANVAADWISGMIVNGAITLSGAYDDAAPIQTQNCGFLSGIHGLNVPKVYAAGHGKTAADIGSRYRDGAGKYFRIAKTSTDSLTLWSEPSSTTATWTMATSVTSPLTWISGGSNHAAVTVTGQTTEQQFPMEINHTTRLLRNGATDITAGEQGYAAFVDLVDEFDMIDPSTIDTTQTGAWSWTAGASAWIHVTITYRALPGYTAIRTVYDTKRSFNTARLVGTQVCAITSASYANRYYYLPKAKSTSGAYNWTAPQLLNGYTGSSVSITQDSLVTAGVPPDRAAYLFTKTGEDNYDIGFVFGYAPVGTVLPSGSGASWYPWGISAQRKSYPTLRSYDAGVLTATTGDLDFWCYRQWIDPKAHNAHKFAYWNNANQYGDDIVWVDYHGAQTNDATVLPQRMWGKTVTVVDTLHVYNISAAVPPTGILISTTPAGGDSLGYAVLRLR